MGRERVPVGKYTDGEVKALLAPLVGLDNPQEIQTAVVFAWCGDHSLRIASGVTDEEGFKRTVHNLLHELIDMM